VKRFDRFTKRDAKGDRNVGGYWEWLRQLGTPAEILFRLVGLECFIFLDTYEGGFPMNSKD